MLRRHEKANDLGYNRTDRSIAEQDRHVSGFVKNSLCDLPFANLAPLPPRMPDQFVEMLDRDSHGTKPDLRLGLADFLKFGATGEVQQVGRRTDGVGLAVGIRNRSVEYKTYSFQACLKKFLVRFQVTNRRGRLLLDRHEMFPESIHFLS
jgi:hypothetical protein